MTLFIVLDIELILFWPLATVLNFVGPYGFWIATVFFGILTIGFVIELASGALAFAKANSA